MKRRHVLRALGIGVAGGLAGCQSTPPDTDAPIGTDTHTRTATHSETTTPTSSPTQTASPTETSTDTPADTPTETPETTPSGRATDQIDQARQHLTNAIEEYISTVGSVNVSWQDVDARHTISSDRISSLLDNAKADLSSASNNATVQEQTETIDDLRVLRRWLSQVVELHENRQDCLSKTQDVHDELIAANWQQLDGDTQTLQRYHDVLASRLQSLTDIPARDSVDALNGFSTVAVDHSESAIAAELEAASAGTAADRYGGKFAARWSDFQDAIQQYLDESYNVAESSLLGPTNRMPEGRRIANNQWPDSRPPGYDSIAKSLLCWIDATARSAVKLRTAADHRGDEDIEQEILSMLQECDAVADNPTTKMLRDGLESRLDS